MGNFSCKGCPDRECGCHSWCDKYLREKKEHEESRAKKNSIRDYYEYVDDSSCKIIRGKRSR